MKYLYGSGVRFGGTGADNGESGRDVRHRRRGLEGVAQECQAGEGAGRKKMEASSADRSVDVQGRDGVSVDSVGEDDSHHKREGGVQWHRVGRGPVESLRSGG